MKKTFSIMSRDGDPINLIIDHIRESYPGVLSKLSTFELITGKSNFLGADEDEVLGLEFKVSFDDETKLTIRELDELLAAINRHAAVIDVTLILKET